MHRKQACDHQDLGDLFITCGLSGGWLPAFAAAQADVAPGFDRSIHVDAATQI